MKSHGNVVIKRHIIGSADNKEEHYQSNILPVKDKK